MRTAGILVLIIAAGAILSLVPCTGCREAPAPSSGPAVKAPPPGTAAETPLAAHRKEAIEKAVAYLLKMQSPEGTWGEGQGNVGITALCAQALLETGKTIKDEPVRKAVDVLVKHQQPDGGIYDVGLQNYTTSIALVVLVKADPKVYAGAIEKATAYLKAHQLDETESIDKGNPWYGGAGYGSANEGGRPDLSNEGFFLEAMKEAGVPKDDPLWAKAVLFVSRCQDRSESNDGVFVGTDSGGMIYSPNKGGESKAGTMDLPSGGKGLRAYASMTYTGLKSFMYAGLNRDDPRVQAALTWIQNHWTFDENPELGQQGLYYYYMVAARALSAWGEPVIRDDRRREHPWKDELTEALLRRQKDDGSWTNEADRWFEGYGPVPTSYALIALENCR